MVHTAHWVTACKSIENILSSKATQIGSYQFKDFCLYYILSCIYTFFSQCKNKALLVCSYGNRCSYVMIYKIPCCQQFLSIIHPGFITDGNKAGARTRKFPRKHRTSCRPAEVGSRILPGDSSPCAWGTARACPRAWGQSWPLLLVPKDALGDNKFPLDPFFQALSPSRSTLRAAHGWNWTAAENYFTDNALQILLQLVWLFSISLLSTEFPLLLKPAPQVVAVAWRGCVNSSPARSAAPLLSRWQRWLCSGPPGIPRDTDVGSCSPAKCCLCHPATVLFQT